MAKKKNSDSKDLQDAFRRVAEKIREIYGDDTDRMLNDLMDSSRLDRCVADECKVTADEWSHSHPFGQSAASDRFYASLASEIWRDITVQLFMPGIPDGVTRFAAIMMAAYLEDTVSNTGIWQATRNLYRRRFGDVLPFFEVDPDDYFEDDVNIQDLKVLCWMAFNRIGATDGRCFSPLSEGIARMAQIGFDHLVEAFDKAPVCKRSADSIGNVLKKHNCFELRSLGLWLATDCPLTADPYAAADMMEDAEELFEAFGDRDLDLGLEEALYDVESKYGWKKYIGMMGCGSWQYLAEMARIRGLEETAALLDTVRYRKIDAYEIIRFDKNSVWLKSAAGEEFEIDRISLKSGSHLKDNKAVLTSIVKFGDRYFQNGVAVFVPSLSSDGESPVSISEFPEKMMALIRNVVKKNRGRRAYYCKDENDVRDILGDDLFPKFQGDPSDKPDNLVLLLSDEEPPRLLSDDCDFFKDPKNPFYDSADKVFNGEEALSFIVSSGLPDDLIDYIVAKKLLPDAFMYASQGKRVGKRLVQDNMAFLFRFYRAGHNPGL